MKQLRRVRELTELTILGTDGEIGSVQEVYFDDRNWAIRYLVGKAVGGCSAEKCCWRQRPWLRSMTRIAR